MRKAANPTCPYCLEKSKLVLGRKIYPLRKDLAHKYFYLCFPCHAYVGTHPGTKTPLGTLANIELRSWRSKAHAVFDKLWKEGIFKTRSGAYLWLMDQMDKPKAEAHIAMFNVQECKNLIEISEKYFYLNYPNSLFMGL